MSEWQPIETAPRDGTPVLIWDPTMGTRESFPHDVTRKRVYYDDRRYAIGYWRVWQNDALGERIGWWGNRNHYWPKPTHWMPLPNPPTPDKSNV